jgi:hypothetical protein
MPQPPEPDRLADAVGLTERDIDRLRIKLRCKVVYHVGNSCADVDDLVEESLLRFLRAGHPQQIRDSDKFGAFLSIICSNVILEYRLSCPIAAASRINFWALISKTTIIPGSSN